MMYALGAIIFGLIGTFTMAWLTRNATFDTADYWFMAVLVGLFGVAWVFTVPIAIVVGIVYYTFKFFRKVVKGDIKFVADKPTL